MATAAEMALLFKVNGAPEVDKALKGVVNGIQGARKEAEKGGGILGGLSKAAGTAGLAAVTGGLAAVAAGAGAAWYAVKELVPAAEGMGDAMARAGLVFKEYSADAAAIIKDNAGVANSLGMTREAYIANAASVGDLITSMGVGADQAFDMSLAMTELAPKLGAFAGVEADKAMDALTKGLSGATKGLKEMGIVIPEIPKGLDEAAKAAFIYDEIMRQSADAQTAWADNSGDMEVQMARVSAAIHDTKAAFGEALLPIISAVTEQLTKYLLPALGIVQAVFTGDWAGGGNEALARMRELVGPVADAILLATYSVSDFADAIQALVTGDTGGAWEALSNGVQSAIEAFGHLTGLDISGILDTLFGGGDRSFEGGAWEDLRVWLVEFTTVTLPDLWEKAKEVWAGVMAAVAAAAPYVIAAIDGIIEVYGYLRDKGQELWDRAVEAWNGIKKIIEDNRPQIEAAIAGIKQFAQDLQDAWLHLKDEAIKLWGQIAQAVEDNQPKVSAALDRMGLDGEGLRARWESLKNDAPGIWASIGDSIHNLGPVVDDLMTNLLGPAWEDLKLMWAELKTTAAIYFAEVSATIREKVAEWKKWWEEHGGSVKLIFTGIYLTITGIFRLIWAVVVGVIRIIMALFRNDDEGVVDAVKKMFKDALDGVKRTLGGLGAVVGGILADVAISIGGQAAKVGRSIIDGIWNAITGGKDKVAGAATGIGNAAVAATKSAIQAQSPSKVFHQIGEWIVQGLVNGIARNAQKAAEAAAKMAGDVTGAAKSIIELFTILSGTEAARATDGLAERFRALVGAVRPFRDVLVAVGQEMRRPLKGSITELGAIGKGAEGLGKTADAIKSVADAMAALGGSIKTTTGGKGGETITETLTFLLPDDQAIAALTDRARAMLEAMRGLQDVFGAGTGFVGADLLATAVGAMADALKSVADVDLSGRVEVTSLQMLQARNMISRMIGVFSDPGGLLDSFARLSEDTRKLVAESAGQFADAIGSLADIVKVAGSFGEKLEFGLVDLAASAGDIRRALGDIVDMFDDKGGLLDVFSRMDTKTRDAVVSGAKALSELLGSLVSIIKASEVGKVAASIDVSASAVRDVLLALRNLEKAVVQELREQLRKTTEELELSSKDFKAMADWFGSVVAVLRASQVGEIVSTIDVSASAMRDVLLALRNLEKAVVREIREQLRLTTEELEKATKDFKAMADWLGSIAAVVKATQVGDIASGIQISASAMRDVLLALRNLEKAVVSEIREQLKLTTAELEAMAKDFKAMSDFFGSIAAVLRVSEIGDIAPSLSVSASALRDVLLTIQNLTKAVLIPMRAQLMALGDLDAIGKDFKSLADFIGSVASIIKATAELPAATSLPQLTAALVDRLLEPIRLLAPAMAALAPEIDTAANEALASMGPALESLTKVFGVIETVIGSAFFGSGKRARSSSSMDVFKRRIKESIKAAVTTLVDALAGLNIPADLGAKLDPLRLAAEAIRAAFEALADVKLPRDLAAILEAARQLAGLAPGSGGGAGGAGGAGVGLLGRSQGGLYGAVDPSGRSQGGLYGIADAIMAAIAAQLDGWKGDIGCAAPILKAIGADLAGWKGDIGCAAPIMQAIAADLDGWKDDRGCAAPIMTAIANQLDAWVQRGSVAPGPSAGGSIMQFIGKELDAWVQRGATPPGVDIGGAIMQFVGKELDAWVQRGSVPPGTGGGAGTSSTGGGFSFGSAILTAQTVTLNGPVNIGMSATLQFEGGRSMSAALVDALITDTGSFDRLLRAEDQRRKQKP